jgi:hypothetical protein
LVEIINKLFNWVNRIHMIIFLHFQLHDETENIQSPSTNQDVYSKTYDLSGTYLIYLTIKNRLSLS